MSSEDVNPDCVHQSNEIDEVIVLCFGKGSDAKKMAQTCPNSTLLKAEYLPVYQDI